MRQLSASLCILYLTTIVLSKPLLEYLNDYKTLKKSLWKRQVTGTTGVIATSSFLRRAYQACEQWPMNPAERASNNRARSYRR